MTAFDLAAFAERLQQHRDTAFASTITAHQAGDMRARSVSGTEWFAYAHTLSMLHLYTSGEHGTPIDAQESPFDAINRPVAGQDRKAGAQR